MEIKLADALLRRKELQEKVKLLKTFRDNHLFYEVRAQRVKVQEGLDELSANYPKLAVSQVTQEHDFAARQLRLIDSAIQQANWTTMLNVEEMVMNDFVQK